MPSARKKNSLGTNHPPSKFKALGPYSGLLSVALSLAKAVQLQRERRKRKRENGGKLRE
jgi:hypothetical protein